MHSRIATVALTGALTLTLASCAGPSASPDPIASDDAAGDGHGHISGAAELAEPQLGLTVIDHDGAVTHLDLLDESVTELGEVATPTGMTTDGRYLFAETEKGIEIVDSGVWTWDHIDHFHYYRAEPRLLGSVEGVGAATVATTNLSTTGGTGVSFAGSGDAVLLDTEALSKGRVAERFRVPREPHDGLVVPVGSFALVTEATDGVGSSVVVYTEDGAKTGLEEPCRRPAGTITTRVGAVVGCDDGALLAHVTDDELRIERIPYPDGAVAPAAGSFDNREGRPTVAGLAGEDGIWLLDTREREWTYLPAPTGLLHATAVDDDDGHVLALTTDGRVLVLSSADGSVVSETVPLVADSLAAGESPTLIADQQRAYLSAPTEKRLYEIDYADGARIARTFDTATEPAFVAETGR